MPAIWATRRAPNEALLSGGRGGTEGTRIRRWGERMAVVEVAIALALALGAGLVVRSYGRLMNVDPGFDPENVLATTIELPPTRYSTGAATRDFFERAVNRVRALPGRRYRGPLLPRSRSAPPPLARGGAPGRVTVVTPCVERTRYATPMSRSTSRRGGSR